MHEAQVRPVAPEPRPADAQPVVRRGPLAVRPVGLLDPGGIAFPNGLVPVTVEPEVGELVPDGAIPAANMGLNAALVYTHSGSTTTGLSGAELNSATDAADASQQLLILGAVNREDNDTTLTHCKVEVLINQHTESQGTVGTLGI